MESEPPILDLPRPPQTLVLRVLSLPAILPLLKLAQNDLAQAVDEQNTAQFSPFKALAFGPAVRCTRNQKTNNCFIRGLKVSGIVTFSRTNFCRINRHLRAITKQSESIFNDPKKTSI